MNAVQCNTGRRTDRQRNQAHEEGVHRVSVVGEGSARVVLSATRPGAASALLLVQLAGGAATSTRLQAAGVIRQHRQRGKLASQLAAGAAEAAAAAHGRAAAAVWAAVQDQPHGVAAIDRLGIVPAQQEQAFASARSSMQAQQLPCSHAMHAQAHARAVRSHAHIQMFTRSCARMAASAHGSARSECHAQSAQHGFGYGPHLLDH